MLGQLLAPSMRIQIVDAKEPQSADRSRKIEMGFER